MTGRRIYLRRLATGAAASLVCPHGGVDVATFEAIAPAGMALSDAVLVDLARVARSELHCRCIERAVVIDKTRRNEWEG